VKFLLGILAEAETQEDVDDIIMQIQAVAAANMGAGGMGGLAPAR